MDILYVCYQGVTEPLTQTQVISYLEGLAAGCSRRNSGFSADNQEDGEGHRVVLLTFEPVSLGHEEQRTWRQKLAARGIEWHWVRYHKRPRVPATAWDILVGCLAVWRLIRRRREVRPGAWVLHARVHVPGVIAAILKRVTGAKFLFDIRGFLAEEYADAGIMKQDGLLYKVVKWVERRLVRDADGLVVLTRRGRSLLESWYPHEAQGKLLEVIPSCVDLRLYNRPEMRVDSNALSPLTLVYVGKLGGWYLIEEMARFVALAREVVPNLRWQVWTQADARILKASLARYGLMNCVSVGQVSPEQLPAKLLKADVGISFIKPSMSKLASSPTKVGEYLAAGLPVILNAGIGDTDELILGPEVLSSVAGGKTADSLRVSKGRVGIVLYEFSESAYREAVHALLDLLAEPDIRNRCREVASQHLDLQTVAWTRYRRLYRHIEELTSPVRAGVPAE